MSHVRRFNRADRRRHRRRMQDRAHWVYTIGSTPGYFTSDRSRKLGDHIKHCSCPGCGNPRRHFGKRSRAELRAMLGEQPHVQGHRRPGALRRRWCHGHYGREHRWVWQHERWGGRLQIDRFYLVCQGCGRKEGHYEGHYTEGSPWNTVPKWAPPVPAP